MERRSGRLLACLEVRGGCSEWEVEVAGETARAVAFAELAGPLRPGDAVLLNTTAAELGLGTGGAHFVIAAGDFPAAGPEAPFPGREAGHILKLRYTPLQHRVLAVEEEASPHRQAIVECAGLDGTPVVVGELLSQTAASAIAAHAAAPDLRLALVQLDSAALPLEMSRLVTRLRDRGILNATITVGQAFGGDYEAVNVYSGLIAAAAVVRADIIFVTQGPGNVGTGTEYGFSGISTVEALSAAATLGGMPILIPRISDADPRPTHRGLSHHTKTILKCARRPVAVPFPSEAMGFVPSVTAENESQSWVEVDVSAVVEALEDFGALLSTMGRAVEADPLFFRAAAAAGRYAADRVRYRRSRPAR